MPKRIDANQPQIIEDLRKLGFLAAVTSDLGRGFPDIVVGDPRTLTVYLFEVKNPEERWGLTKLEIKFHALWHGMVYVIETTEMALALMGYGATSGSG